MRITHSVKFEWQYRKPSDIVKRLAEEKEALFMINCHDPRLKTHKLKGEFDGYYAFSINNKYRVIFSFEDAENIRFHYVGTHDIYE